MTLIIDEIYIAKRVEYSGGEVQGLTADWSVASTLLCFMVKSLASKYKDIVAIYPMDKLTSTKLFDCFNEVMSLLRRTALNVVAILVDNAATNRKYLTACAAETWHRVYWIRLLVSQFSCFLSEFTVSRMCTITSRVAKCLTVRRWTAAFRLDVLQTSATS